jgi:hypothetical protein
MSKWCLINQHITNNCSLRVSPAEHKIIVRNYLNNAIEKYDPVGFLIVDGTEAEVSVLYDSAIKELESWCHSTGKKIPIFTSSNQYAYDYPDYTEKNICPTYDITNYHCNLAYYRPDPSDFLYFPIGDDYSPDLLYTCYNNRPCDYRNYTVNSLFGRGLQNLGIITYRYMTVELPKLNTWKPEDWDPINNVPYLMPLEDPLEDQFVLNTKPEWIPNSLGPSYCRGVIDIVTESRIDKDEFYLSEKTNKPLLAHKPFLVVGAPGYHKWLKEERQIELYDELFDYSFDDEPDYIKRVDGIVDNLERLSKIYKSPEDYKQLWNSVKAKTQRNFLRYMADMRSGIHVETIMHFIGLNSPNPDEYRLEKFEKYLTPDSMDNTGNDIFKVAQFFKEVVIPHRYNYKDNEYIGFDLLDHYSKFFSTSPKLKVLWESQCE